MSQDVFTDCCTAMPGHSHVDAGHEGLEEKPICPKPCFMHSIFQQMIIRIWTCRYHHFLAVENFVAVSAEGKGRRCVETRSKEMEQKQVDKKQVRTFRKRYIYPCRREGH